MSMWMLPQVVFPCCFIITLTAWIRDLLMLWIDMFPCCFTLITWIANSFMLWLYIFCQVAFLGCYILTLITWIAKSFMLWIYMSFQIAFQCCFIVTLITGIRYSHALTLYVVSDCLLILLYNHTYHMGLKKEESRRKAETGLWVVFY